jgi:hypothetical protein
VDTSAVDGHDVLRKWADWIVVLPYASQSRTLGSTEALINGNYTLDSLALPR